MKVPNPFPYSDSNKRYYTYDYYLRQTFGEKVARVTLDALFTCPNRDGTKGVGGCAFCSGRGSGDFCGCGNLREQFDAGVGMMSKKWGETPIIAYFQAFSGTYAPTERLRALYEEALSFPRVVGLSIATRADCINPENAALLLELSEKTHLTVELGLQSISDETAKKMNVCRSFDEFLRGYELLSGVRRGIHIINGLPGENDDDMMATARAVAALHPDFLKIHLLHVIRGTALADMYERGEFETLEKAHYCSLVASQLEIIPQDVVIGRVTGDGAPDDLIAPEWSKKKLTVINDIDKEFVRRGTYQGIYAGK